MSESKLNNFQQLEEEQIKELVNQKPDVAPKIEMGIMGSMRTFNFGGNIVELYLSKIIDLFISLLGGSRDNSLNDQDAFTKGEQK